MQRTFRMGGSGTVNTGVLGRRRHIAPDGAVKGGTSIVGPGNGNRPRVHSQGSIRPGHPSQDFAVNSHTIENRRFDLSSQEERILLLSGRDESRCLDGRLPGGCHDHGNGSNCCSGENTLRLKQQLHRTKPCSFCGAKMYFASLQAMAE